MIEERQMPTAPNPNQSDKPGLETAADAKSTAGTKSLFQ